MAAHVVDHGNCRRFSHAVNHDGRRLQLFGSQAVSRYVDDVIYATEDSVVTVTRLHGAVVGKVRPVVPVLTLFIGVVLLVVRRDEAIRVSPNRLEDARPRVANTDVARY